jgi:hypothetical protein
LSSAVLNEDVADALEEIGAHFGHRLAHESDGQGGAIVTIEDIELPSAWSLDAAPMRFVVPYNFPATPPYPYYLPQAVQPPAPWSPALQPIEWRGEAMIQVSLRNNSWDPARDSVLGCVLQVCDWLRAQ